MHLRAQEIQLRLRQLRLEPRRAQISFARRTIVFDGVKQDDEIQLPHEHREHVGNDGVGECPARVKCGVLQRYPDKILHGHGQEQDHDVEGGAPSEIRTLEREAAHQPDVNRGIDPTGVPVEQLGADRPRPIDWLTLEDMRREDLGRGKEAQQRPDDSIERAVPPKRSARPRPAFRSDHAEMLP